MTPLESPHDRKVASEEQVKVSPAQSHGESTSKDAVKIKADDIAAVFRREIRAEVDRMKAKGVQPTLVAFLSTGDASARKYSEWTMKACEADGIKFEVREV